MNIQEYITELDRQYQTGKAREHSYRPALQQLLAAILPDLVVTNEPARSECGAPDFILTRKTDNLPVAFLEAKDIDDPDLAGRKQHKEQFNRYKASLNHIIFTDYLDFHLYEYGIWTDSVRIGELRNGKIYLLKGQKDKFDTLIRRLANAEPQPITSATKLAGQMAAKARLLAEVIKSAFKEENECYGNQQLQGQLEAFQRVLIHDLTPDGFADIYAQTIAYGMFAARLHDPTPETFSRQEAATLIPKTNPFLRQIFQNIAGYDLDERIAWIVDELAVTFRVTNVAAVMGTYSRNSRHNDPMIHFYEDFLSAYDSKLRKAKGVWYTPQPVVRFIVKAVNELLQREFGLPMGLADYSTIEHEVVNEQYAKGKKGERPTYKRRFHKVQILDPATGTGTFLAEAVNQIYDKFRGMEGMWQSYVEEHLLPRLNGFELLMASYAIAHLKLDMLLQDTGYIHKKESRLHIYLTNSLEEYHPDTGSLFAQWLSNEANEANRIKRDTPVMVMIGNPPYNVSSNNKGEWITRLMSDYKKDLKERNTQPLSDDYIKFFRLGHYYIEKNREGILAYISNNSFIDGIIHRQMRKRLLETFDRIYILDMHGSSKKKETCPDGSKDENVFDIQQGVSINIFIKTGKKQGESIGEIFHYELFGRREEKYQYLDNASVKSINWQKLNPEAPYWFFVPKNFSTQEEYEKGFKMDELFVSNVSGIKTSKDNVNIWDAKEKTKQMVDDLLALPEDDFRIKYKTGKDSRDWSIARAKVDIQEAMRNDTFQIVPYMYRPFDLKFIVYTGKTNGIVAWPRFRSLACMLHPLNLGITTIRINRDYYFAVFCTNHLPDKTLLSSKDDINIFPLYLTPSGEAGQFFEKSDLTPNFAPAILEKIEQRLGEKVEPLELFDYIYAVLHNPAYRERYKEFLKIDFPRIPYPSNPELYHNLAQMGSRLRKLHVMDNSSAWHVNTTYPVSGKNQVETPVYREGAVYINQQQYFGNVPLCAWEFYIGGYQPAQKWLKDRKGHTLSFSDIRHYQEIIATLSETIHIMEAIKDLAPLRD